MTTILKHSKEARHWLKGGAGPSMDACELGDLYKETL